MTRKNGTIDPTPNRARGRATPSYRLPYPFSPVPGRSSTMGGCSGSFLPHARGLTMRIYPSSLSAGRYSAKVDMVLYWPCWMITLSFSMISGAVMCIYVINSKQRNSPPEEEGEYCPWSPESSPAASSPAYRSGQCPPYSNENVRLEILTNPP